MASLARGALAATPMTFVACGSFLSNEGNSAVVQLLIAGAAFAIAAREQTEGGPRRASHAWRTPVLCAIGATVPFLHMLEPWSTPFPTTIRGRMAVHLMAAATAAWVLGLTMLCLDRFAVHRSRRGASVARGVSIGIASIAALVPLSMSFQALGWLDPGAMAGLVFGVPALAAMLGLAALVRAGGSRTTMWSAVRRRAAPPLLALGLLSTFGAMVLIGDEGPSASLWVPIPGSAATLVGAGLLAPRSARRAPPSVPAAPAGVR